MTLFKKLPGRLPEILRSLSNTEREALLKPMRILFGSAIACSALSSLPFFYMAYVGDFDVQTITSCFGVSASLWIISFAHIYRARYLLSTSYYATENSISVSDLRGSCFSWNMLKDVDE